MKRFTQLLILFAAIVVIVPAFLPNKIEVQAEKEFDTSVEFLFTEFNNLKKYSDWEPWGNKDSTTTKEYFSPYLGKGAGYKWKNNDKEFGEIIITKSEQNQLIEAQLEGFGLGEKAQMQVEFTPIDENKTKVKWSVEGEPVGYFSRYFVYFNTSEINELIQQGFQNLTQSLNNSTQTSTQSTTREIINIENFEGLKLITIQNETTLDPLEIKTAKEESLGMLFSYLIDYLKINPNKIQPPVCYYEYVNTSTQTAKFYCGFPIQETIKLDENMQLFSIPAGQTIVTLHKGSYNNLEEAFKRIDNYAKENNLKTGSPYWEVYIKDPNTTKSENDLLTKIYMPIK